MQQLADKMDTQRAQINKLEKGHIQLKEFWLLKLSKALECDISDILLPPSFIPPGEEMSLSQICAKMDHLLKEFKRCLKFSAEEEAMLDLFRGLTKDQQIALLNFARNFSSKKQT